jgi:hypothetical protein
LTSDEPFRTEEIQMLGRREANDTAISRRSALGATGGALSGVALAGLMQAGSGARSAEAAQSEPGIEGLWRVTALGGQSMGVAIYTLYLPDGAVVGLYADPRISFLGRWMRSGDRSFVSIVYQYRRDADGASVGLTRVQQRGELDEGSHRWTGVFKSVFYDNDGAVVDNRQGTLEGVRLDAEPYE